MSHAIAIGLSGSSASLKELSGILERTGFSQKDFISVDDEIMAEICHVATTVRPHLTWHIAIDSSGHPDLDLVYRIGTELVTGRLKPFVSGLLQSDSITSVGFLFFDMGSGSIIEHPSLGALELIGELSRLYSYGGPLGTAYHEFTSPMRPRC